MSSEKFFHKYLKSALAILNSQCDATRVLRHSATAGAAREQIIKDFLSSHLPELITVMSGQIVDSSENYTKQQDIVLVLKSMPRLPFASGSDLIFQEGVVAIMEIKTVLNTSVLRNIGENIKSVRELTPAAVVTTQMGITHNWPANKVLAAIVTYSGTSLESLLEQLVELEDDAQPDLLLDLSKGLLVRNHGLLLAKRGSYKYLLVDSAVDGFKFFLTFLTEITGTLSSRGVQWRKYW